MTGDKSLEALDFIFFVASLAVSVLIGVYFANKNNTLDEFMLGGRQQKLLPVAMSMMTSYISGLTIIGNAAEFYYYGPGYSTVIIGAILWIPFSAFVLLPVFYRLGEISVYGVVSVVFMIQMTVYNAVVLYVPSLSLQSVFGISETISIGAVGIACLIYSTSGGIKAVIWTDFFQAGLMYLSLICIIGVGISNAGGWSNLIELGNQSGRLNFEEWLSLDLTTRHTIGSILLGSTLLNLFTGGCSQIQVQRVLSLPSLRAAQWAQALSGFFLATISLLASFVGLVIYQGYQDCDPYESGKIDRRDAVVIYYVYRNLAEIPGIRGVFVAGIFAATLSTLSSFQNSMAALLLEDIVRPIMASRQQDKLSERRTTILSKLFSFMFGLACIGLTFIANRISVLMMAVQTLFGALGGPLIAAFFLGMLTHFVNTIGILAGMSAGLAFGVYVELYQILKMPPPQPTFVMRTDGCANVTLANASTAKAASPDNSSDSIWDAVGSLSYMWLPVFALLISTVVAIVVSLLTGGWNQQVDTKYLADWKRGKVQGKWSPKASKSFYRAQN